MGKLGRAAVGFIGKGGGVQPQDKVSSSSQDPIVCALVVTLHQDPNRRQRAISAIAAHPAIRVAAIKDRWLPLAVEASDERETQQIQHWVSSLDGVDVADVVAISCGVEGELAVTGGACEV